MNDNYPAASWSCADWYGAPKISHYVFQDSYAPLHACALFSSLNFEGKKASLPIYILDDADALKRSKWQVVVRAYDRKLNEIKRTVFDGSGSIERVLQLGEFKLTKEQTNTNPLLIVVEVIKNGKLADRTFYWANYVASKGCLFKLPETKLKISVKGKKVTVKNYGSKPAAAVNISCPGHLDTFRISDNYFWLDSEESKTVKANQVDELNVSSWNKKYRKK